MKKRNSLCLLLAGLLLLTACSSGAPDMTTTDAATHGTASTYPPVGTTAAATEGTYAPAPSIEENGEYAGEAYLDIRENSQVDVAQESMLTFSLKVDTASYTNVARYLESGSLPPADAVRVEEMVNYFPYEGEAKPDGHPFAITAQVAPHPLDSGRMTAFIRVKAVELEKEELPPSNLVFLLDTSGSMFTHDKLPLLKDAIALLCETLDGDDIISVVTYAGFSSIALETVAGNETQRILEAVYDLSAGGSTAGAAGIETAYALAEKAFIKGGNNRVILATDGDFNVGPASLAQLEELIAEKRDTGICLSVLGFGTGNIRDDIMETLSKHGDGNYSYINSLETAQKVLVEEMGSNLFAIARDVKAQVEFNPDTVSGYRLIGYENRALDNRDFTDDAKDAGEIGAGADVAVLFELELVQDGLGKKYTKAVPASGPYGSELFEVRVRYKSPQEEESSQITLPVTLEDIGPGDSDHQFAWTVASFGGLLRGSEYTAGITAQDILRAAEKSLGADEKGYRRHFIELVQRYNRLTNN